jgi:8-oxo-dGTP pyrophosphatase MutT (NUDIX family)
VDRWGAALSLVSARRIVDSSGLFEFRLATVSSVPESLREQVRRMLTERDPIDDAEQLSIERTLAELDRLADPFDEDSDPVHVTGSAIVVGPRGVLLLKHKRLGLWLQPGGHVDPGETPWDAALREAGEETGLEVSFADVADDGVPELVHVDVHPGGRGHTHLDLRYLVLAGDTDPNPPEGESQEIAWFDWPSAIDRASDDRLTALLRHLAP